MQKKIEQFSLSVIDLAKLIIHKNFKNLIKNILLSEIKG